MGLCGRYNRESLSEIHFQLLRNLNCNCPWYQCQVPKQITILCRKWDKHCQNDWTSKKEVMAENAVERLTVLTHWALVTQIPVRIMSHHFSIDAFVPLRYQVIFWIIGVTLSLYPLGISNKIHIYHDNANKNVIHRVQTSLGWPIGTWWPIYASATGSSLIQTMPHSACPTSALFWTNLREI